MYSVEFTMQGRTALLIHADDVEASDELKVWRDDPDNKNFSVPGDDRSPPWTWQTYLYTDGEKLVWPAHNLMVGMRIAASQIKIPGQRGKTYKELSQNGMMVESELCRLLISGREIALNDIHAIRDLPHREQAAKVQEMGFKLFVKRAKIGVGKGAKKHVRVRARCDDWQIKGVMTVIAAELDFDVLARMWEIHGRGGQGDWRASCPTPGPFGQFDCELKRLKQKATG